MLERMLYSPTRATLLVPTLVAETASRSLGEDTQYVDEWESMAFEAKAGVGDTQETAFDLDLCELDMQMREHIGRVVVDLIVSNASGGGLWYW